MSYAIIGKNIFSVKSSEKDIQPLPEKIIFLYSVIRNRDVAVVNTNKSNLVLRVLSLLSRGRERTLGTRLKQVRKRQGSD